MGQQPAEETGTAHRDDRGAQVASLADGSGGYTADEIRERTDLVEVISSYVALQRAGRRLKAVCPFHQDRNPSLTVDPEKQLWHCFGCGAGGNVFQFVMRMENATFIEAVRLLARRAGVPFREREADPKARSERETLARINEAAAAFFQGNLAGSAAEEYLEGRGITRQSVEKFEIGYAPPGWESLLGHLRQKGLRLADITKAGLCLPRQNADGAYDRFRNRLMFPIRDLEGRVVGFGGRALGQDQDEGLPADLSAAALAKAEALAKAGAKYINSPETPLFRKGRALYGLPQARRAMGQAERAIIVEGYFDCIACHQHGFEEAVATMGTALTEEHVAVLKRYAPRIFTAFDGDSAGMRATLRGRPMFEQAGLEVRVTCLPAGRDPDSFLVEAGAEGLARLLDEAPGMVDYQLNTIAARHAAGASRSDEARLRFMTEAVEVLAELRSAVEQTHYAHRLAEMACRDQPERVPAMEQAIVAELRQRGRLARRSLGEGGAARRTAKGAQVGSQPSAALSGKAARGCHEAERSVLTAVLNCDEVIQKFLVHLQPEDFAEPVHRDVFARAKRLFEEGRSDSLASRERALQACFADADEAVVCVVAELALAESGIEDERVAAGMVDRLKERRGRERAEELRQRLEDLRQRMARGEAVSPEDPAFVEYMELKRVRSTSVGQRVIGREREAP